MLTFKTWVAESGGTVKVAKLLNVTPRSVRFWLSRRGAPKYRSAEKIVKLSKGRLTLISVIEQTRAPVKNSRGR